ncbi:Actin-related protein 2 [Ranunculus cassubicifolius]
MRCDSLSLVENVAEHAIAIMFAMKDKILRAIKGDSKASQEPEVPVVDGYSFPHLTKRMNVAGRHITSYLVDLLSRRG